MTLNKSIAVPGENIIVTGSNFTPNGDIDVLIENESGQDVRGVIPITYINPGMFEFTLLVPSTFSDGEYTVTAQDISTGNTTPPKSFIVNNFIFTPLEITFPSITSTIFKYKTFDIEWKDFISSAPVNGQTGELLKEYTIEASPNNGGIWYQIATKTYKATTGKSNTFTYPYSVTTIGPYLFRITEIGNPQNTATSPPLTAIECDDGGFVASLQWDATVPDDVKSKKPYPYGLAADGAARIYVKLNKNNATLGVSTIQATIQTVGNNGYSGTALLGRIAHASATEIISTSTTYPAGSNNNSNANSYWFWLVAPDDFTTDLSSEEKYREINVDFTITYSDNSTELITLCEPIQICRPALVFAHGILGTQESFKYAQFNNNSGGTSYFSLADFDIWKEVKLLDLKEWGSYQVNADILLGKDPDENQTYENSIISIIKQMHFYGFANKRIDYVAHSMGGAVGRTVINNGGSWYSPGVYQLRNYGKGYINKYISICTPHNGSPIADVAVDAFNAIILLAGQNSVSATIAGAVLATSYFKDLGFVYKGSISQAIANLQAQSGGVQQTETTVKNHLISADVDEYNNTSQNDVLNSISTSDVFGLGMTALFKAIRVVSPIQNFFSTNYGSSAYLSNSDLIVPLSSQLAGKLQPSPFDITTNTTGVSKTSIIYGLDKQHVGIQKNLSIGTRLKVLLNAQMASGFFDETIPPYTVNQNLVGDGEILSRRSTGCMDTVLAYIDTFKIKITSPTSNSILYIDSSLQIAINLKDTIGFENLRVLYKSTFYYSTAKDSIQYFLTTINPSDLGLNSIVAVAQYDSMGCTVYYIDTIAINVATLDSLEGFYITPRARYLNPVQDFAPVYHAVYSTCIGVLRPEADSLTFMILDTNVVVYDSLYRNFVTKDTGSTHIVFSFEGYNDTMFVYISTKNIDNVSSICPLDSIFLYAGVTDSTKSYQWQVDTLNGFSNIIDNLNYTGTDSSTLIINSTPSQWFDYKYRCIISDAYGATESDVFTLRFGMVWTGVIDTTWENPGNWSCNAIPDCNTEVYIPSDAPRYPNIFSEAYCKSIHLADSAYLNVKAGYQLWVGTSNAFLTCPSNVTINLDPGTCDAQYIFSFSLEGVCGSTISQTSGLLSGSFFPIGTTTNCFDLLDNYGAILASCCFDVTVIEYPTPTTTLACNDNIQVSINEICEAFVSTDVILEGGPYSCYNDYLVAVEGYGSGFGGVTITSSAIGQTLNVTVTDPSTGNSCSGTISVEDKIVPQVICSDFTSSCSTYIEPDSTNTPIATDNCGGVILTYSDEEAPGSCPGFSTLIRHWVVTDSSGNSNTCDQIISFLPASLDSVTCPPTYVGSCSGYNSPGTTGYPVYNGEQIDYNGLCNLFAFYSDQDTIIEGYFTVLRTWRIVDTCASLEIECIQNIISTDNEDPILSCPNDYETSCIQSTAPEIAGFPTYSDNCNSTLSYIDSAISGDPCESQNFSRTWTVLDNSNNFATCIQYFTLLPVTLDSLVCPSSYIGSCGDNSDPSVMGYPSIDGYPINENGPCNFFYGYSDQDSITCDGAYITRTWTISDWCTQQTTVCIQDIDLLNNTGQILACPEDILVSIEVGESNVPVGYNVSSACNCGDTIVQTAGLDSGESFPIGTTSNCFILLDSLGATIDSCCFDVTVTVFWLVGGIVFNTQEQIDSLSVNYPFCSIINGPVTIEGSDITNLDGLSSIRYIEGSLIIWNNPVLDDLSGLDSLTYVGEIFTIANNSSLLHIPGFNSIQHIGNYLQFIQDSLLSDISGFNTINSIPELNIQINTALESITGFQS
ncbi:MAG: HYR domain-containing protein [Saprospiraceae bacterium]|nr:HYR domain-containing protein [Candidatus Opimibacter skivensis]